MDPAFALALVAALSPGRTPLPNAKPVQFYDGPLAVEATRLPEAGRVLLRWPTLGVQAGARVGRGVLVTLADGADPRASLAPLGLTPLRPLGGAGAPWLAESTDAGEDGLSAVARAQATLRPGGPVLRLAPDLAFPARTTAALGELPDDPRYGGQWYLERIGIEAAWALEAGGPETTVVVLDNGCDLDHPDLSDKLDPGRDTVEGDDDPSYAPGAPGNEHGTACAGIVGAEAGNGIGIAGTCPGCRLRCVRILSDGEEALPTSVTVEAFEFAREVDAAVASNSWGYAESIPVPHEVSLAITRLHTRSRGGAGTLVVFAAGNDDHEIRGFELNALAAVLTVGAVNVYDEATVFTNFGDAVDVVAPVGTVTTDISGLDGAGAGDYTDLFGGTSSACPVAAGVAALLAAAAPERKASELYEVLRQTARPAPYAQPDEGGHDPVYGRGIIDPEAALRSVLGLDEVAQDAGTDAEGDADTGAEAGAEAGADAGPEGDDSGDQPPGAGGDAAGPRDACACATPGAPPPPGLAILLGRRR